MNNRELADLLALDKSMLPLDGGNEFNRLIFSRSPYLLQHARNPVDWREWGDEAFAEAKRRDIPLFVSIGYATCHWCHVMAVESFSDSEVAATLNGSFVPVKIDREERPDLDDFYMTASRALTGSGGWPLNVFIDHEKRPFFSITYLPKYPRHRTPGFIDLLVNISLLWKEKRDVVMSNSDEICRSMSALTGSSPSSGTALQSISNAAFHQLEDLFDKKYFGFGNSVKFPMPVYQLFLLSRDPKAYPDAKEMALLTLKAMMHGGIKDQLSGGFHRYTVDPGWLTPHFEKMLYDQAMLITAYSEAYKLTDNPVYKQTAVDTARFAVNELMNPEGGFCAALDADSEGEEGLFYTWKYDELESILKGPLKLAHEYWGATENGDLDGRSVFHLTADPETFCSRKGISVSDLEDILAAASQKLREVRLRREAPLKDLKVISAWNGLMITALIRLGTVSGDKEYFTYAQNTARFILRNMVTPEGRLIRNWLETPSRVPGFAEDYTFIGLGLADIVSTTDEPFWKETLEYFGNELVRLFIDATGKISFCGHDVENPPIDIPQVQDGVTPSTAGAAAVLLTRLGRITGKGDYRETAGKIIRRYRALTEKSPSACLSLIMAEEELNRETISSLTP